MAAEVFTCSPGDTSHETQLAVRSAQPTGTAVCGTARTVVWEGGERKLTPYPISGEKKPRGCGAVGRLLAVEEYLLVVVR